MIDDITGWRSFIRSFAGDVILPSDASYDEHRSVWNGDIDKRPLAVVRCTDVSDVVLAVRFARAEELDVAVRSGGHSYAGHSACDDGMIIDLSRMNAVRVDPVTRRATAQGGALLRDVDEATIAHGLVLPAGVVSHTGLAGLALGGGMGHLSRVFGLTCDHFVMLEVVTAEGDVVHASADENPDLLWALRGGGGNFGVVTEFDFRLQRIGDIEAGWICFPSEQAVDVLYGARKIALEGPRALRVNFFVGVPQDVLGIEVGKSVLGARVVCHGDIAETTSALNDLRSLGTPIVDAVEPRQYVEIQTSLDSFARKGVGWYMKSGHSRELSRDLVETIVQRSLEHHGKRTLQILGTLGGAIADVAEMDSAYSGRDAQWHLAIEAGFENPKERAHVLDWTRDTWNEMEPKMDMDTSYLNMLVDPGVDRLQKAYGSAEKFRKLQEVKTVFDAENFFKNNWNVPPLVVNAGTP